MPRTALIVVVETAPVDAPSDVVPTRREINYMNDRERRWLAKHCFWAMCNNHAVVSYPKRKDVTE